MKRESVVKTMAEIAIFSSLGFVLDIVASVYSKAAFVNGGSIGIAMWPGPYGDWGSRKYLLASLDQSLERLGLPYVDIFYHHRMDPKTPLEETMGALATAVTSGKALYVGLSNYDGPTLVKATEILTSLHCPFVINQNRYSILDRTVEKNGLLKTTGELGKGLICFSPLAQGLLTDKYLHESGRIHYPKPQDSGIYAFNWH